MNHTDLVFENYDKYLLEHHNDIGTPAQAMEMLTSDGSFRSYIDSITEGLSPEQKATVVAVSDRERECLLEEAGQLGAQASTIGYAVN